LTGAKIETLVNRRLKIGYYSTIWHAENFATGVYFLIMTCPSGYRVAKKMILLK